MTGYVQEDVASWFERTYRSKGFRYLRPPDAYPIYLQLLAAKPGQRLLDVACGPGLLLHAAGMRGLVPTGIDISEAAIALARDFVPGAELRVGNAEHLPFADGSFDLVTCIGSLERFFDRKRALAEMRRVAAPDARFCLMVRNAAAPTWVLWRKLLRRQEHAGHQDAQDLVTWRRLFEDSGFSVDDVLMDQWLRQKLRKLLRGWRRHDFRRPEPVARPLLSMRFVYEYILLLRKSDA